MEEPGLQKDVQFWVAGTPEKLNLKVMFSSLSSVTTKLSILPRTAFPSDFKADWISLFILFC